MQLLFEEYCYCILQGFDSTNNKRSSNNSFQKSGMQEHSLCLLCKKACCLSLNLSTTSFWVNFIIIRSFRVNYWFHVSQLQSIFFRTLQNENHLLHNQDWNQTANPVHPSLPIGQSYKQRYLKQITNALIKPCKLISTWYKIGFLIMTLIKD